MNDQTAAQWRQATAEDLGAIDAIGNGIHTSLPERPEVFAEKLTLFPAGCLAPGRVCSWVILWVGTPQRQKAESDQGAAAEAVSSCPLWVDSVEKGLVIFDEQ